MLEKENKNFINDDIEQTAGGNNDFSKHKDPLQSGAFCPRCKSFNAFPSKSSYYDEAPKKIRCWDCGYEFKT